MDTSTSLQFHQKVQHLRKRLGLSQEELAARLGLSFATINRWEAGRSKPQRVQLATFEKLWEDAGLNDETEEPAGTGPAGRRRRGVQRSTVLGNKGMEQMLWD